MDLTSDPNLRRFELALAGFETSTYEMTLFVIGASDLSARAIANARDLCDRYLKGRHHLVIVDLFEDPGAVSRAGVFAAPTLVKHSPLPVRRLVGDLSRTEHVLRALDLPAARTPPSSPNPPILPVP